MIPRLLRERGPFRVYWAGQTISLFGDQITLIAVPLIAVLLLHASAAQMGYLIAAAWAPYIFLALHAGAWVDRWGRRRQVMIAADLGRAFLVATVPVAFALHRLTLAQLYTVVFLSGTASVFFNVSSQTLFVSMLRRDSYLEGQSLLYGSRAFSFISGPGLGGLLVQLFSGPIALVADAISFLASALSLSRIAPAEPEADEGGRGQVLGGVRFIRRSGIMKASLAATATINLFTFAYSALFVLYAARELRVSPATLGVVMGSGAVGGLIGSLITARLSRRIGVGPAFMAGCVLFPAPLLLVPVASGPMPLVLSLLFAAQFGAGLGVMVLDISVGGIFAALVPDRLRARVAGAYTVVNYGVRPVGALLGGALGTALGLRHALLVAAVFAVAGVLWLVPSPMPRLAALPETAEAR